MTLGDDNFCSSGKLLLMTLACLILETLAGIVLGQPSLYHTYIDSEGIYDFLLVFSSLNLSNSRSTRARRTCFLHVEHER